MQLTHGMDCPPGGDLTATTALLQVPAVSVSVTANAADAVQQVDFVVSTTGASQADFRVTMPASNAVEANAQQPEAVALSTGEDAWLASPTSPAPVGASVRGVKRHTRRWHPMKSRCNHGSGVPPCPDCRRAGLGPGSR